MKRKQPKASKIFWEKAYAYRTDRFIEWCQDNPAKRVKLFSDSTQDAREEGRTRVQLNTAKKNTYQELAQYVFENDAELGAEWLAKPQAFVSATQRRHTTLRTRYNEQVKCLGQTGAGLTLDDLQIADRTKGLVGEIMKDFPWFSALHGWWRTNPVCNMAYSTADPGQDFAAQAAILFKMQPDFLTTSDQAPSPFPSTSLLPAVSIPAASTSGLPDHDVIGENYLSQSHPVGADGGPWDFNKDFNFEGLDMDHFAFDDPSTSSSLLTYFPGPSVSPSLPVPTHASGPSTSLSVPTHIPDFSMSSSAPTHVSTQLSTALTIHDAATTYTGVPTTTSTPAVVSLNDGPNYHPPRRPPLVPSHAESQRTAGTSFLKSGDLSGTDDSDSDAATAHLLSNLNLMKRKTPTPEVSSEETDPKGFFSTDPSPSSAISTTGSKSLHKRPRLSVANRTVAGRAVASHANAGDASTPIIAAVRALRDEQTNENRAERDQRKVVHGEQLADKKEQREHEWAMQQKRLEHEATMAAHQKGLADAELRKMELQLEILRFQERTKAQDHMEPESGEGNAY
ncbi:hypothetical protein JVT61DRAFT_11918 [Boletus reticuloceps]|uniref:Uncharacterized protein n=1 Tax=Boletus reticuloceps TaxID=495285 RepID=A0A8I2YYC2_9AGAM|nr:hypothetical protein JVT61DRAFT_11918 [Boletus reticuloceps]